MMQDLFDCPDDDCPAGFDAGELLVEHLKSDHPGEWVETPRLGEPRFTRWVRGGQPGAGCSDPRDSHRHHCGFCGAELAFSRAQCQQLLIVPPCPRCGERQWRSEIDELTDPDWREGKP